MNPPPIVLSYFSCNYRSILVSGIIVLMMIISSFFIVLIKKISIHSENKECAPLFFFLGETTGCQSLLYKTIKSTKKRIREKERPEKESLLYNITFFMHQFHL
jgi:hypothetical protein